MTILRYNYNIIEELSKKEYFLDEKIKKQLLDFKIIISKESIPQKDNHNEKKWRNINEHNKTPKQTKKLVLPENEMY